MTIRFTYKQDKKTGKVKTVQTRAKMTKTEKLVMKLKPHKKKK